MLTRRQALIGAGAAFTGSALAETRFPAFAQAREIKRPKLLPFCSDNERVGGFGTVVGICAISYVFQQRACLPHAGRVERPYTGAHVLQSGNQGQ